MGPYQCRPLPSARGADSEAFSEQSWNVQPETVSSWYLAQLSQFHLASLLRAATRSISPLSTNSSLWWPLLSPLYHLTPSPTTLSLPSPPSPFGRNLRPATVTSSPPCSASLHPPTSPLALPWPSFPTRRPLSYRCSPYYEFKASAQVLWQLKCRHGPAGKIHSCVDGNTLYTPAASGAVTRTKAAMHAASLHAALAEGPERATGLPRAQVHTAVEWRPSASREPEDDVRLSEEFKHRRLQPPQPSGQLAAAASGRGVPVTRPPPRLST